MHGFRQVAEGLHWIGAVAMQVFEKLQRFARIGSYQRFQQIENAPPVGEAQHRADIGGVDLALGERNRLIEDGEPIAHRAFGGPRDHFQGFVLGLRAFRADNAPEMRRQLRHVDAT